MPKLSHALAASALLVALSAPGFAADLNSSTSQRNSTTIQHRDDLNAGAGVNTRSGTSTRMNDRDDVNGSTSLNSHSTLDRNRPQSAQMPKQDQDLDKDRDQDGDMNGRGRSATSPGHEMQEHGSVPGSPGASGFAPGHR